jgi:uncharacterized lipoprotein YddW (UPF0748 family)
MLKHWVKCIFTARADGLVTFSRKFRHRVWLALLVAFSFAVTAILPLGSNSQTTTIKFKDIQGMWAQSCIEDLAQQQIITGYPDGTFKPNNPVTRAEFAVLVGKAFPRVTSVRSSSEFQDVPVNFWAKNAINQADRTGFMSGYPDRTFNPNQQIPRVQALVSLANGLKYTPTSPNRDLASVYSDAAEIPAYARNAIAAATEKRLVVNYPDVGTFNPSRAATRAEVAAFLCQIVSTSDAIPPQYVPKFGGAAVQSKSEKGVPAKEIRGVWLTNIDSDVLFDRRRLTAAIDKLHELNFNTLYPTVWNCGYTLYPSRVAEKVIGRSLYPETGLEGRDLLQETVDLGHQQGMAVIPWFEFGFMGTADSGQPQCDPTSELAKRHPDWLLKRRDGSVIWKEGPHDRVWFNPLRPEVQDFFTDLVVEIVTKYQVDGIQFDDHLGFPVEFGYDEFTVNLYQQEHAGKSPPEDPKDPEWVRWRADRITKFVQQLFKAVKLRRPQVLFALSPNPWEFSYTTFLQDWKSWERQGLIEELVIQLYRNDLSRLIAEMERPEVEAARRHIPVGIGILSGLKPRPVPIAQIQEQVASVRQKDFAGVSFFFYESLWNLAEEPVSDRQSALKKLFPQPIARPNVLTGWQPRT